MRPRVIVNVAMSADGKIALPNRRGVRISNEEDLRRVHALRAACDAVLVGVGTVLMDNPKLTVKREYANEKNPVRIVLDSDGSTPEHSAVLDGSAATIIATDVNCAKTFPNAEVVRMGHDEVDLKALMEMLSERGVKTLLIEGGGTVVWSFLRHKFVDEIKIFVASFIIGGHSTPTPAAGEGVRSIEAAIPLKLENAARLGDGVLLEYAVVW